MGRPCVSAPSQSRLRANRASPHNLAEPLLRGRYSCYSNYIHPSFFLLKHQSKRTIATPLRGRIAGRAIQVLTRGGLINPMQSSAA